MNLDFECGIEEIFLCPICCDGILEVDDAFPDVVVYRCENCDRLITPKILREIIDKQRRLEQLRPKVRERLQAALWLGAVWILLVFLILLGIIFIA